jgi:hypothetical protein
MARSKVRKTSGLRADGTPNAYWRRFKQRLESYEDISINKWDAECALGHILKRFKEHMGIEYTFSYSGPPSKCQEMFCVRRMISYLGADDGEIIKAYIDWVYDSIIISQKITIKSIAFFFSSNLIVNFKTEFKKKNKITRATKLPSNYEAIINEVGAEVYTYGDLSFAKQALNSDPEDYEEYEILFVKLKSAGFDEGILDTLEG